MSVRDFATSARFEAEYVHLHYLHKTTIHHLINLNLRTSQALLIQADSGSQFTDLSLRNRSHSEPNGWEDTG